MDKLKKGYKISKKIFLVILLGFLTENSFALEVGDLAPACLLKNIKNTEQEVSFKQFSGQVVYVDFWASWCGPCIESFPYMNSLERNLKEQGLELVAINLDENIEDAEEFLNRIPANFSVVLDEEQQCAREFDVQAMPSSYLIDRKGIVQHIHLGFRSGEVKELQVMIDRLLADKK